MPSAIRVRFIGQLKCYSEIIENRGTLRITGGGRMKGYFVNDGYMGMVEGRYMLFASEEDYREYMEE